VKLNDSSSKFIEAHIDDYEGKIVKKIEIACFNLATVDLF
jgi:hypothetical protein